jgi:hypothetical protein
MNSKVRLDWLSLSLEGDEEFRQLLITKGSKGQKAISGIPMYLHGYDMTYYRLYIQDEINANYPVAVIMINHPLLWGGQYDRIYDVMLEVSGLSGFISYHITRVDLSVLIDRNVFADGLFGFVKSVSGKVKRNNIKHFGRNGVTETVYLGTREKVMLRIYDKRKELLSKYGTEEFKDYVWKEVWKWGECYNVEYELRRKWLKDWGINTLGDLFGVLESGEVWRYLTKDWVRLEDEYIQNGVKCRRISEVWVEVMGAVFMDNGFMYEEFVDYLVRDVDPERLYSTIKGLVNRLAAVEDVEVMKHRIYSILKGVRGNEGREYKEKLSIRRVSEDTGPDCSYLETRVQEVVE